MVISCLSYAGDIKKFCYTTEDENTPYILWSNDIGSQGASVMLADELKSGHITLAGHFRVEPYIALFAKHNFKVNECILLNKSEKMNLDITQVNLENEESLGENRLFPVVHFDLDGRRRFGLIQEDSLAFLEEQNYERSVKVNDVLDYSKDETLTLIYVVCPKNREDVCQLAIKHQGQWVLDEKENIFQMDVLARSNWKNSGFDETVRIHKNGDTPQGIYRIIASMDTGTRKDFGDMCRIDLDARYPAYCGHTGYNDNINTIRRIMPVEAYTDYWFNEWPLAHALGRQDLRIHANGPYDEEKCIITPVTQQVYRPTAGCINTGDTETTQRLWDKLVELDVFNSNDLQTVEGNNWFWNISKRYGDVFLILIDGDS